MPWIIGGAIAGGAALGSLSASNAADKQASSTDKAVAATQQQASTARGDLAPYREAGSAALGRLRELLGLGSPSAAVSGTSNPGDAISGFYQKYLGRAPDAEGMQSWMKNLSEGMSLSDIEKNISSSPEAAQAYAAGYRPPADQTGDASSVTGSPLLAKFSQSDLNADPVYNNGLQFGLDEGTKAIERRAAAGGGYDSGAELKALTRFGNDYGSTKAADSYGRFTNDQDRTFGKLSGIAGMGSGATTVGVGAGSNTASNLSSLYTGQGNASAASTIAGGNALAGGANSIGNYYMQQNLLSQLQGGGARTLTPNPNLTGAADLGAVG